MGLALTFLPLPGILFTTAGLPLFSIAVRRRLQALAPEADSREA